MTLKDDFNSLISALETQLQNQNVNTQFNPSTGIMGLINKISEISTFKIPASITISVSSTKILCGQVLTCSVFLKPTQDSIQSNDGSQMIIGDYIQNGVVSLYDGNTLLGQQATNLGHATFNIEKQNPATLNLRAKFIGNEIFTSATSAVQSVQFYKITPTLTVNSISLESNESNYDLWQFYGSTVRCSDTIYVDYTFTDGPNDVEPSVYFDNVLVENNHKVASHYSFYLNNLIPSNNKEYHVIIKYDGDAGYEATSIDLMFYVSKDDILIQDYHFDNKSCYGYLRTADTLRNVKNIEVPLKIDIEGGQVGYMNTSTNSTGFFSVSLDNSLPRNIVKWEVSIPANNTYNSFNFTYTV